MRGILMWGTCALVALLVAAGTAGAKPGTVSCPISEGFPTGGDVQWAFTDSGRPNGHAIRSSYVHGRGNWTSGRATGTGCTLDFPKQHGQRDLVLGVSGKSKLKGHVKQGGWLGVRIVLKVKVRASDDPACLKGATGTITMFASYYAAPHHDTMNVRFNARCTGHNLNYSGSSLHVYIARHGAQVN